MQTVLILLSTAFLLSCRDEALLYEKDEYKGQVVLSDDYVQALPVPASEVTVYMADNDKADPYLYSTKADKNGIFRFPYQPSARRNLFVVSRFTNSAGLTYAGFTKLAEPLIDNNGEIRLALNPRYPGGVLKVVVQNNSTQRQPINGAEVFIFSNQEQANTIKDANPSGAVQKLTTNDQGIAFFYNLKTNSYYVAGKLTNAAGVTYTNSLTASIDATLSDSQKEPKTSTNLFIQPNLTKSKILATVRDGSSSDLLTGLSVYLFTSMRQAESVRDSVTKGYAQLVSTTVKGEALFPNLDAGTYYIAVGGVMSGDKRVVHIHPDAIVVGANLSDPVNVSVRVP